MKEIELKTKPIVMLPFCNFMFITCRIVNAGCAEISWSMLSVNTKQRAHPVNKQKKITNVFIFMKLIIKIMLLQIISELNLWEKKYILWGKQVYSYCF